MGLRKHSRESALNAAEAMTCTETKPTQGTRKSDICTKLIPGYRRTVEIYINCKIACIRK